METITLNELTEEGLKKLLDRLDDAETHRKGLLVHSQNLEHLVSEAQTHASNLEKMMQERLQDLEQTKALCYKYEQILQSAGIDLDNTP